MAVTTTVQDLLNAAYAKSLKNKPGTIASESSELLQLVIRIMRSLYAGGARVNPMFFGESAVVAVGAGVWLRPAGAQLIFRLEAGTGVTSIAAGTEIIVAPFDQRSVEPGKPAVYRFGQNYVPVSASATVAPIAPQDGNIKFFYSKRPTSPATLGATLDALWIEDFNEIPILRVARYLAMKDGRGDEVAGLTQELSEWVQQYIAFLEHETANEVRSYGHVARFNTPSLIPIVSLLMGDTPKGPA